MVQIECLEGWLIKQKSKGGSQRRIFSSGETKRWFKVQELESNELALCYFKTPKEKEARGWIFLRDVTAIRDDVASFMLQTSARTMVIQAQTRAEHKLWLQGLVELCANADIVGELKSIPHQRPQSGARRMDRDNSHTSINTAGSSRTSRSGEESSGGRISAAGSGEHSQSPSPSRAKTSNHAERNTTTQKDRGERERQQQPESDRGDHRVGTGARVVGGGGVSSRLHDHIRPRASEEGKRGDEECSDDGEESGFKKYLDDDDTSVCGDECKRTEGSTADLVERLCSDSDGEEEPRNMLYVASPTPRNSPSMSLAARKVPVPMRVESDYEDESDDSGPEEEEREEDFRSVSVRRVSSLGLRVHAGVGRPPRPAAEGVVRFRAGPVSPLSSPSNSSLLMQERSSAKANFGFRSTGEKVLAHR